MLEYFIQEVPTRTGRIYIERDKGLEWLSVGDYGKEANLKANFLGLEKPIYGVPHKEVDLSEKWVLTLSTQKGCQSKCNFCDVPNYKFRGNVTLEELWGMVNHALSKESAVEPKRLNIHFARMGEPTFNRSVIQFCKCYSGYESILDGLVRRHGISSDCVVHPVVSTMLPKHNRDLEKFLHAWCEIKDQRRGEAGLQFSIQSTDEAQRDLMFNKCSLSLVNVSALAGKLVAPSGRKYTLNFAVTKDTILDAKKLGDMFNKDHWVVKLTPIHLTHAALENGYNVSGYEDYDVYERFEAPLLEEGFDVLVFVPSKEEDEDRITCGNALITR